MKFNVQIKISILAFEPLLKLFFKKSIYLSVKYQIEKFFHVLSKVLNVRATFTVTYYSTTFFFMISLRVFNVPNDGKANVSDSKVKLDR